MVVFALIFLEIFSLSQAITVRKENSLTGPYIAGEESLSNWALTGSAQLGDTYLRLTTDEVYKNGAIWNTYPSFSNNWELQIHFHIHGKGVFLNGNGMAIWFVSEADILQGGPVFGSKDFFSGLGVFIDTFANQEEPHKHRHPYISAMVNNGSLHYEHDEDGTAMQIGGCHVAARNLEVPTKIAISYVNNNLGLYVDNEGTEQWKMCFKSEGVHLPTGYFFGVSASTSDVSDNHDIIKVTLLNMDSDDKDWMDLSNVIPKAENIQIPQKHRKQSNEEDLQKVVKKRDVKDDLQKVVKKRDVKDDGESTIEEVKAESETEEIAPPATSLIRKLVYITGAASIALVSLSVFRKYRERRRVRMEKRLY